MSKPARQASSWAERIGTEPSETPEAAATQEKPKHRLRFATYNIMNYNPAETRRRDALASDMIQDLELPDIIALQEVQDNDGAQHSSEASAHETLKSLLTALNTKSGSHYRYAQIDPESHQDGGQPGANIRQAFLYNTDTVELYDAARGKGEAQDAVEIISDKNGVHLSHNPGRIDPSNPAFNNSRKPLVAEFVDKRSGKSLFVVNVHLNSKAGDDDKALDRQRIAQAKAIDGFVRELDAALGKAGQEKAYIIAGDCNSQPNEEPVQILSDAPQRQNLANGLEDGSYYTYIHHGEHLAIDHIIASVDLKSPEGAKAVIINTNQPHRTRTSDHNPVRTDVWLKRHIREREAQSASQESPGQAR